MSGKSNAYETAILQLLFNATGIANVADNTATSPLTNLYVALHTADPTGSGNQASNECNYTGYARVAVARSTAGWTVSGSQPASVSPAANIQFPAGTGGSGTASFWSVGSASTGSGTIYYSGPISPTIATGSGVTPILTTASTITEQ